MSVGELRPAIVPWLPGLQSDETLPVPCVSPGVRRLAADVRNLPRYVLKYCVILFALIGVTQVWLACGDGPIAPFHTRSLAAGIDPAHVTAPRCTFAGTPDGARRAALEPAVAILEDVHPGVAQWVRETGRRGKLRFADGSQMRKQDGNQLATYDAFSGTLTIGAGVFAENDGTIATLLCHEYRHARQRFPKTLVYLFSFVWNRQGDETIIENDALLFEQDAHRAVFGTSPDL